jgi:uncharacterized protein (TIGR00369 family)
VIHQSLNLITPYPLNNPYLESLGFVIHDWADSRIDLRFRPGAQHGNRSGFMNGGLIATMLDASCGYAGLFSSIPDTLRHSLTISLSINYVAPAPLHQTLRAIAEVTSDKKMTYVSSARLLAEDNILLATAQGAFRRKSTDGISAR